MNKLSELLRKADALKTVAEAKGAWAEEDWKLYEDTIAAAEREKQRTETERKAEALAEWMAKPDGQSIVKAGYAGEALPEEGHVEGITAQGYELYAYSQMGEEKLKALKSGAYKDAFVGYIKNSALHGAEWRRYLKDGESGNAMKVLQEGIDTQGGFWVPPDIRAELVKKMAVMAVVRQNAYAFTTGSNLVTFPKVTYTTDNLYTSGVRFSWTDEAPSSDISEATNPVAGRVQIPVHTATAALIVTRATIEDGQFDILGYSSGLIGESFALGEEDAFWTGTGAGRPQGITVHANAATASSSGGMYVPSGTSAAVTWGGSVSTAFDTAYGLLGVEAVLPPQYESGAKWYFNKATKAKIRALQDANARPLWSTGDTYPSMANGYQATLLGYPFQSAQFIADVASNSLSVVFGDLQGYYIADRVGLSVEVFREIRGLKDEVVLYARKRVGGQLVHPWKVKLLKAAAS